MTEYKLSHTFQIKKLSKKDKVFEVKSILTNKTKRNIALWNYSCPYFVTKPGWTLFKVNILKNEKEVVPNMCKTSCEARSPKIDHIILTPGKSIEKIVKLNESLYNLDYLEKGKYILKNTLRSVKEIPKYSIDDWKVKDLNIENNSLSNFVLK